MIVNVPMFQFERENFEIEKKKKSEILKIQGQYSFVHRKENFPDFQKQGWSGKGNTYFFFA